MGGFNYGGQGDGTGWSSERGDGPAPGGGQSGSGGSGNTGSGTGVSQSNTAFDKQVAAIKDDPVVRQRLSELIRAAYSINPNAKLTINSLDENGKMSIIASGLNADQARQIGLTGLVVGFPDLGSAIGDFETGHPLAGSSPGSKGGSGNAGESSLGVIVAISQGD